MTNETVLLQRSLAGRFGGRWSAEPLHASSFCATWGARGRGQRLFVKSVPLAAADVLEAEADGLEALASMRAIAVPEVAGCWRDGEHGLALLALQWLELRPPDAGFGERYGRALGELHRGIPPAGEGRYGWRRDNLLGGTPQRNRWSRQGGRAGWIDFLAEARLGALNAELARRGGATPLVEAVAQVIDRLPQWFDDGYLPRASLIHGDLWSGNWAMQADGTPVIYDPAVSCSDAEAELAMMELFGSPPAGFWHAYRATAGLHEGYARRRGLYQLYHLLNHVLLFGGGYTAQALACARALLGRGAP
ncbi:fructosamine kinase family protein [Caldimonas thermodepolymerans]|uniref:Fructosamine-3-kinase n=1 Tax=Caldimonas thermodepolymerans TaxID=215580 RepID=A0AA46DAU2_9BURK|nr:fructosamine kinase family protein [Caldimonas thermodepolymerans]TCP02786.1 fructosamine-3-kinase [Caldimonas thermodepolymerans]UZG48107.1 fructosamine kinase family protein [Caldimonas thermodepolymerans]